MLQRWLYRSRQFFAAWGDVSRKDMAEAREVLGPELYRVFAGMPRQYRLHSLKVYRGARRSGCNDKTVWQAALLHDSGKYDPDTRRYVTIGYRVLVVLLASFPVGRRMLKWLGREGPTGAHMFRLSYWRYPFFLHRHHPELGARIASANGASKDVSELIASHHTYGSGSSALRALQAADDNS
ncbi:MAG TPA: HD domain-containing protein [Chloroflexia bacterium]|nr:HD domain-containing protein [Chloroflexia bacterium]